MQKRQFACVFLISSISLTGLYYNRSAQLHGKYGFYIENYTKRFKFHLRRKEHYMTYVVHYLVRFALLDL
jgi:hypothetical protein